MKNKLIGLSLTALLFGCTPQRQVNHPERENISAAFGHDGYLISRNNVYYRFINDEDEGCRLSLSGDAELYDHDCNGTVDNFYDNQGRHSCEENQNERCNLANRIFQQKKEKLRVNEIHQLWLNYMQIDTLPGYLE